MKKNIISLILLSIAITVIGGNKTKKPNIVLIFADDLGIGLLGHEGQKIISTPHIDSLASQGMRFENAYSNMLCAPARASLITGLHDCHKDGFEITNANVYTPATAENYKQIEQRINNVLSPIPANQKFIAQIAKEKGYKTAEIGKLEWGFAATHQQMKRHGWDYYYGYLDHERAHGFYPPFLFEDGMFKTIEGNTRRDCGKNPEPDTKANHNVRWDMKGKKQYSQDLFMNASLNFIEENKEHPFFLYFPTQLPHGPVAIPKVHPDFANDNRLTQVEKEYASMVKMLDDNVGEIKQKLRELGLLENTILIFTADNGHELYYKKPGKVSKYKKLKSNIKIDNIKHKYYTSTCGDTFDGNGGRAGLKRSNLQGGINIPLIVHWPAKIKKGQTSNRLVANYDFLATLADILDYNEKLETDGLSYYNELIGKKSKKEHKYVLYSSFTGPCLVGNDGWKIRTDLGKDVFELFYLPNDFKEEHNLALTESKKLSEMKALLLDACEGNLQHGSYWPKTTQINVP